MECGGNIEHADDEAVEGRKRKVRMAAIGPPFCKICQVAHGTREPHIFAADAPAEKRSTRNTSREGRDVLKADKATSTASTERPDPLSPLPPARGIKLTKAEKVRPGKPKTAPKKKAKKWVFKP